MQQPEVHLHPVAQASLAKSMAESRYRFLIEIHSDHMVDRLRICVMRGHMNPEDLGIIYFEPNEDRTRSSMYNIVVDDAGNLDGEPDGYRQFFLEEMKDLPGFST